MSTEPIPAHMQAQQEMLPELLKIRQALQKPLINVNRMPHADILNNIKHKTVILKQSNKESEGIILECLEQMIEMRNASKSNNTASTPLNQQEEKHKQAIESTRKRKRNADDMARH